MANIFFFLFSLSIILIVNTQSLLCQTDQTGLQQEVKSLQQTIAEEKDQNNFPAVEDAMDRLIVVLDELKYSEEELSRQVQMQIRYSLWAKRFFAAYQTADNWLETHPDDMEVTHLLGNAALYLNRNREAREALRAVYESEPENEEYLSRYLRVLKQLNDSETFIPLCREILLNPGRSKELKQAAIDGLIDAELEEEALRALKLDEAFAGSKSLLAFVQGLLSLRKRKFENALASFRQVEDQHHRYAEAQQNISLCLSRLRWFPDAVRHNLKILSGNPYNQNACINLAQALARLKKTKESKMVLSIQKRLVQEEMPTQEGNYYWSKGNMVEYGRLHAKGLNLRYRFQDAERLLKKISQTMPESLDAKIHLGKHYFTTLQACKAEAVFQDLLDEADEERLADIRLLLMEALLRQDQADEALAVYERLARDETKRDSANALLGTFFVELKQEPKKALQYLDEIEDAAHSITAAKAKCYLQLGQSGLALQKLSLIPKENMIPGYTITKIQARIDTGKTAKAEALFEELKENHPDLPPLLTLPVEAALAEGLGESGLDGKAERVREIQYEIQQKVFAAQRAGLPRSVPLLSGISELYEEIGDGANALLFARRAYDAVPVEPKHLKRVIRLMDKEEYIFERLHLIYKAKRDFAIDEDFADELEAVYGVLGLDGIL